MKYLWKKINTRLGTYVMYDLERNPVKEFGVHEGDVISFEAVLPRAVFMSKLDVPGFGSAVLFADNEEAGYEPSDTVRDFLLEGTKSRLHRVKKYLGRFEAKHGFVPAEPAWLLREAETLLREAAVEAALAKILWAGEKAVLLDSQIKIGKRGNRDDFSFVGCMKGFTDGGDHFKNCFLDVFGEAVIPTHWGCVEPYEGEQHYDVIFDMLDWCTEHHIPVRGHALVWFSDWWEGKNWMGRYGREDYEGFKKLVVDRAKYILSSRPNAFTSVDFNEPLQSNPFNFTFDQHVEICKEVYEVIRTYSPNTKLMINFYDEWQGNYGFSENDIPAAREWKKSYGLPDSVPNRYCVTVPMFLDRCKEEGIQVDVLGLQFHDGFYDLFDTMELIEWWSGRYHLPIQLTEVSTPSKTGKTAFHMGNRPVPLDKYWRRPWDERLQEEWYRDFATYFYSTDCVTGLTCWSISDAPTQWGEFLAGHPNEKFRLQAFDFDGILDVNNVPKPAYYALREMAEAWNLATGRKLSIRAAGGQETK